MTQVELERFLEQVRAQRARAQATAAADGGEGHQVRDLVDELALITEMLLTAEEELRVQNEQLNAARLELDRVHARNEELFGAAPAAYLITDAHGMVVDANHAAGRLFGFISPTAMRRSIVTMFAVRDRPRVRALVGQAAAAGGQPQTAHLTVASGIDRDAAVSVEAHTEPQSGVTLLRWQLTLSSGDEESALQRLADAVPPSDTTPGLPAPATLEPHGELSRLLSLARADLGKELSAADGADAMLARVVELACRWVPGAEQASVCQLPRDRGKLRTLAATDDRARACDKLQRDTEQGPAVDATVEHTRIHVDDLAQERQWRLLTAQARDLGIRSILACELPLTRGGAATLNLYSSQPSAFSAMAELIAPVFASRASTALANTDQVANLRAAIDSRKLIGQAVGILMERHRLTEDEAFQRLISASQTQHIKLRDLAARITESGEEPDNVSH
jgi:ANTAR domain/GAF domain/PAS fold